VDVRVRIGRAFDGGGVVLTAEPAGGEEPVAFLWEVQDARPALADGNRVRFEFDPVEPTEKLVRLTAFTEAGCRAVFEERIETRG